MPVIRAILALLSTMAVLGFAQQRAPVNLNFAGSEPGQPPKGWYGTGAAQGFPAVVTDQCAKPGRRCAVLRSEKVASPAEFGNLMQSLDAADYRGRQVRFSASVRVESTAGGRAALWLRVDRPNNQMGFFDNMGDRPIVSSNWESYEIYGDVSPDATGISFGIMLSDGAGSVYIDNVSFEIVAAPEPEEEIPFKFQEVLVPMRDGVRLQTVILTPKDAKEPLPILLNRTPYGVPKAAWFEKSVPASHYFYGKYINVIQNLRGRFRSEGKFVMQRPPHDPRDPKGVDETTDAWDTIDWLMKNVPGNNGKAGIYGGSYCGWTTAMAALNPHPAVKAVIEEASPADMFLGDDFHHNGAFRLSYGFEYSAMLETNEAENFHFQFDRVDTYDWYLALGPLKNAETRYFQGKIPTWADFVRHPNFDEFWQRQTVIKYLNAVKVPILNTAGWWDQEDFYGPQKIYAKLEASDEKKWNYFVAGPWNHGQWLGDGSRLGPVEFGSDTSKYYREQIFSLWFAYWLRGEGKLQTAQATVFETGTNQWRQYEAWPPKRGVTERRLYLHTGRRLSLDTPAPGRDHSYDEYVSDPANPVPYRPRPVTPTYPGPEWPVWLVQDQRFVDHRPDVLSWETEPLTEDLRVVGDLTAELFASTSGSDSDWVVKLIDVYPDNAPVSARTKTPMSGYELIIADEILRGRFRSSFENPQPIPANKPLKYLIDLHTNDHVFLKRHRIMVQVQSTWFPLYDRNPQRFVPNIFEANEGDYRKAMQRVYHSRKRASAVVLPVMEKAVDGR